jgi:SAM-dependent methyltransferase
MCWAPSTTTTSSSPRSHASRAAAAGQNLVETGAGRGHDVAMEPFGVSPIDARTAHNRATYDRIAAAYAESKRRLLPGGASSLDAPRLAFARRLDVGSRLADLGCGSGEDAAWFAGHGLTVVGVDLSRSMLALTRAALGAHRVAVGDLRALPLGTASFDAVWSAAALLHVPEAGTRTVLDGVRRVLRPGGVLGLVTALGDGVVEEPVPYAPEESRWFVYRDPDVLAALLGEAGLEVLERGEVAGNRRWGWFLASG